MTSLSWAFEQVVPEAFTIDPNEVEFAHLNFASISQSGGYWNGFKRASDAAQNDFVTFAPRYFKGGTWAFTLMHITNTDGGIYTVSISTDNVTWTDLGTIDGYAASSAAARSALTGLTIAEGKYYVRLKMATKNASSSNYRGAICIVSFARTGA